MAKLLTITVVKVDGSRETYAILPKTIVAFERHYKTGLEKVGNEGRMEHVYWLAWDAERTVGKVVKPFDSWLDDLVSADVEEDAAPLAEASPPS